MGRYPSQDQAKVTNKAADKFRKSCLASPQMAGIPTTFNDADTPALNNWSGNSTPDMTGGALKYRDRQRRNSQ